MDIRKNRLDMNGRYYGDFDGVKKTDFDHINKVIARTNEISKSRKSKKKFEESTKVILTIKNDTEQDKIDETVARMVRDVKNKGYSAFIDIKELEADFGTQRFEFTFGK